MSIKSILSIFYTAICFSSFSQTSSFKLPSVQIKIKDSIIGKIIFEGKVDILNKKVTIAVNNFEIITDELMKRNKEKFKLSTITINSGLIHATSALSDDTKEYFFQSHILQPLFFLNPFQAILFN